MSATIRERLSWNVTPDLYDKIRRLWIAHSKAEDERDLQGLIDTLSENCVYEIIPTGQRWEGHAGARRFYTSLLTAFPDAKFALSDIVIGPQGVFEVTELSGTHLGPWAGVPATGRPLHLQIIIHFPWNPDTERFDGERVYYDTGAIDLKF